MEHSLHSCLEQNRRPFRLEQGNEWYCQKCKKHQLAEKQMELYRLPQVLILHLKRFKAENVIKKNSCKINFPLTGLDMSQYLPE